MTTEAPEADTSRALFVRAGELLYGPQFWQSEMARALGVSDRSVRYWLAGRPIPTGVWGDVLELVEERRGDLGEVRKLLAQLSNPT